MRTPNERAYDAVHRDPDRAAIVTSDIDLFWSAYSKIYSGKLQTSAHPEQVLEEDYLLRGSPGLQDFVFARIHSADLGYFEGYRITQAYYEKAPDKKKAIREILTFQDADKLLKESGYAPAK